MISYSGPVWRILWADRADRPLDGVASTEGRFHHSGQPALYASLTEEGVSVAIRRYVAADDPPRVVQRYMLDIDGLHDIREEEGARQVWQGTRATGARSPTWSWSDAARDMGARGMLYRSRSRPDLTHIVLFDWQDALRPTGHAMPWSAPVA